MGKAPPDPVAAVGWTQRMLIKAFELCAVDPKLSERDRRNEMRSTARVIASLMPFGEMVDAMKRIKGQADYDEQPDDLDPVTPDAPEPLYAAPPARRNGAPPDA